MQLKIQPLPDEPSLLMTQGKQRILIVADIHLGYESDYKSQGITIPSQTPKILKRIQTLIRKNKITQLIILGDLKHGHTEISISEWAHIPEFLETLNNQIPTLMIKGNHDGDIKALSPRSLKIIPASGTEIILGDTKVTFIHGHAWPRKPLMNCDLLVTAHIHPSIQFPNPLSKRKDKRPVWVRTRWHRKHLAINYLKHIGIKPSKDPIKQLKENHNVTIGDPNIIILPSFTKRMGTSLNNPNQPKNGVLVNKHVIQTTETHVYLLDGTYLDTLHQLQTTKYDIAKKKDGARAGI